MKAVSKSYFKQDPKVRENLEREIRIMKLLKNCEYVVRLLHVQVRVLTGGLPLIHVNHCIYRDHIYL